MELTEQEKAILLQLINQSSWKGEGIEALVEIKKKLQPKVQEQPKTDVF